MFINSQTPVSAFNSWDHAVPFLTTVLSNESWWNYSLLLGITAHRLACLEAWKGCGLLEDRAPRRDAHNFYIHQNPSRESKEINFLFISVKIRNAILTPSFNKQGFIFNGKGSFFYIFAEWIDQMVNTLYTYYPDHCFESSGNPNSYKKQILKLDSPDSNKAVS